MICSAFRNAQSLALQFQLPKKYPTIDVLFVDLIFIFTGFYIVSIISFLSIFKLSFCFRPVIIHFTGVRQSIKNVVETSSKTVESSEKRNISNNNQSSNKVKGDRYPQTKNQDDQKNLKHNFYQPHYYCNKIVNENYFGIDLYIFRSFPPLLLWDTFFSFS